MYQEKDIAYESPCGKYWVLRLPKSGYYEVYKTGITHSTRCSQIGYSGDVGLDRAKAEITRRLLVDNKK